MSKADSRLTGFATACYRIALRILPRDLRDEYGQEMLSLFGDRIGDADTTLKRVGLLVGGLMDIVSQALRLRLGRGRGPKVRSPWMDSLRADIGLGYRRLIKRRTTSAAAVLSLALAIGASTSVFRLIDALLLRPLPVNEPGQLYAVSYLGQPGDELQEWDSGSYPMFRLMREAVEDRAELMVISPAARLDVSYGSDQEIEKAFVQRLSGGTFATLGVGPATGRVFSERDDQIAGGHPYAVLSFDYWTRRFGQDPGVVGRQLRRGTVSYEIVGVARGPFIGVEPGIVTDIFVPTMMGRNVESVNQNGLRTFLRVRPGASVEAVRETLQAVWGTFQEQRLTESAFNPPEWRRQFLETTELRVRPASAGVSVFQAAYGRPLLIIGALVSLVLIIACANVANLMSVQAAARARDMALRVSIGAGRSRLMQLVLVESALLGLAATALGAAMAWWSAPFVVAMLSPRDNPIRLLLPADWRVVAFGVVSAMAVTLMFGLAPALRASAVKPVRALKSGDDTRPRRRLVHGLVALQAAFCFVVLFMAGLFVSTAGRLTDLPTGFSSERLITLDTQAQPAQAPASWDQVNRQLRATPGVEAVALAGWPLLDGSSVNAIVEVNGRAADGRRLTEFLCVSPGWLELMGIPLLDGDDFMEGDAHPGIAIVNETFARLYLEGESPVGRSFERVHFDESRESYRITGVAGDVRYLDLRGQVRPTAYVPCRSVEADGSPASMGFGTFVVRTAGGEPLTLSPALRRAVAGAGSQFRVTNVRTQQEINDRHTVSERMLSTLAVFFGGIALLLAAVGLYGVLHHSVLQRRREIGVRMAVGAGAVAVARAVASRAFGMIVMGVAAGFAIGIPAARYVEGLLFGVDATDVRVLVVSTVVVLLMGVVAVLPGVVHAVRIDPAGVLRAD